MGTPPQWTRGHVRCSSTSTAPSSTRRTTTRSPGSGPSTASACPIPLWRIHRTVGHGRRQAGRARRREEVEERHGDELRDRWREEYTDIKARGVPAARRHGPGQVVGQGRLPGRPCVVRRPRVLPRGRRHARTWPDDIAVAHHRRGRRRLQARARPAPRDTRSTRRRHRRSAGRRHAVRRRVGRARRHSVHRAALRRVQRGRAGRAGAALVVDLPEDLLDLDWEKYLSPLA